MKRFVVIIGVFAGVGIIIAAPAYAGVFGKIKEWITGEAVGAIAGIAALAINAGLGYLHNKNAARYNVITKTLAETGEFLAALGNTVQDANVTREELAAVIKEGADVVNIYKPTPFKYQPGAGNPETPAALRPL